MKPVSIFALRSASPLRGRLRSFLSDSKICFFSFLLPFLAMMAIFIGNQIYPFGDGSFMHSDMYHQYVPFLQEFLTKIRSGESLFYSWKIGMGSNYLALFVYYCASPLNWLMLLLPGQYLIEFMSYMVVLKIGLCGFTFSWYLKERFHTRSGLILLFSTFYAMSGFVAAYNWDVMWMDCLFLAPLILLGLERLVHEGKAVLYCVTLALSILSNYYISIMICLFLCLYFLVLLLDLTDERGMKYAWKRRGQAVGRFALYSLLAGGMAAVLLFPELAAMSTTEYSDFNFPKTVSWYFSIWDVIARHATGVEPEAGLDHWPNLFCSSAVFFLIPLYAFNKKIPVREKFGRFLLCAFLLISFSVNLLNYIWHGFNYPNSLPCRQSFLYIFLVLTMCFEAVHRLEGFSLNRLLECATFGLFFLLLSEKIVESDAFAPWVFVLSAALIAAYALLLYGYKKRPGPMACRILAVAAIGVVAFEATFNMAYTSVSTTSRSKYLESIPAYRALVERVTQKDPGFYRFEKTSRVTKNDGALAGYPTASLFSSTANTRVEDWYDRMGMSESKVFYCFDGQTPFTSALLNVHYTFSRSDAEDPSLYTLIDEQDGVYLYENNFTLPAGFILEDGWNLSSSDLEGSSSQPFDMQNAMAASTGVQENLFDLVSVAESGPEAQFSAPSSGHYYAYCDNNTVDTVKLSSGSLNKTFTKINYDYILDLGYHEAGEQITLTNEEEDELNVSVALLNPSVLSLTLETLGRQSFTVDSWDSTHVTGHINVTTPGRLLLSIANEPGWTLKVDGAAAEIEEYDSMFISVELPEGEHEISLTFYPAGLNAGIAVSLISLGLFSAILVFRKRGFGMLPIARRPDSAS